MIREQHGTVCLCAGDFGGRFGGVEKGKDDEEGSEE